MGAYKYLAKNIGLFSLSELVVKLVPFLMVPLYTYYLSQTEYGFVELIQVTLNLVLPVLTLSVYEGVFRFALNQELPQRKIFSIGLEITGLANIVVFLCLFILKKNTAIAPFWGLIVGLVLVNSLGTLCSFFARAIDKITSLVLSSILSVIIIAALNVLFIVVFHWGAKGYLLAQILGNAFKLVYLVCGCRLWKFFRLVSLRNSTTKLLLSYSLPLIPNAIFWWVNSSIDKYFLTGLVGMSAVGLYSAAGTIPKILNVLSNVFNSAWRISAIREKSSEEKETFFIKIYDIYTLLLILVVLAVIVLSKVFAGFFLNKEFYEAWSVIPTLVIGLYFDSINGFLGSLVLASGNTRILFTTTMIGAGINIALNFFFIPLWGIQGAAVATCISHIGVWLPRVRTVKMYLSFSPEYKKQIFSIVASVFLGAIMIIKSEWAYFLLLPVVILVLWSYRKVLKEIKEDIWQLWIQKPK